MKAFIIKKVSTGYKFDLFAANGERIATSEVYGSEAACRKGIQSVCKHAPSAGVEEQWDENHMLLSNPKFEAYRDKSGAYRFRLRSRNGKIIAISDGYTAKASCLAGIESVRKNAVQVSQKT